MSDGINTRDLNHKTKGSDKNVTKYHAIQPLDRKFKALKQKRELCFSTPSDPKKTKANNSSCQINKRPKKRNVISPVRCLSDLRNSDHKNGSITYKPLQFIHCHANENDPLNEDIKVTQCVFQPDHQIRGGTTHLVASCGGQYVCIIDCDEGKVVHRFRRENEEFSSLAWSLLELESDRETYLSVLAAGGKQVRLLIPDYRYFSDLRHDCEQEGEVTSLLFHPVQSHVLFVGSAQGVISMWDIGIPCKTRKPNPVVSNNSFTRSTNNVLNLFHQTPAPSSYLFTHSKLSIFHVPNRNLNPVLNMVFMDHYSYLIAGCEDGIFSWNIPDSEIQGSSCAGASNRCVERGADLILQLKQGLTEHDVSYDGLAKLNDTVIIVKLVNHPQILVVDFAGLLEQRRGLSKFNLMQPSGLLHYMQTPVSYIDVSCRSNLCAVLCGSPNGTIWVYDLDSCVEEGGEDSKKRPAGLRLCEEMFLVLPCLQLHWPSSHQQDMIMSHHVPVINSTDMSHDGQYVVGVSDNNLVCVWKLEQIDNNSC